MMTSGMYSSDTPEWATPQKLFDELNAEFDFTLDPCATKENAKCAKFYTKEDDGLAQEWPGRVYVNPPYGRAIGAWVKKAHDSVKNGESELVVMLLPARTDTDYYHRHIFPYAGSLASGCFASTRDIVWASGLIDGEGCVFIRKNEPTATSKHKNTIFDLGIKVTMTDFRTVEKLKEIFGVGHLTKQDKTKMVNHKNVLSWTCYSDQAEKVLRSIYPFVLTKREQVYLGLTFQQDCEKMQRGQRRTDIGEVEKRRSYYNLMRDLKHDPSLVSPVETEVRFIKGRLKFNDGKNPAPFPSAIVIFKK